MDSAPPSSSPSFMHNFFFFLSQTHQKKKKKGLSSSSPRRHSPSSSSSFAFSPSRCNPAKSLLFFSSSSYLSLFFFFFLGFTSVLSLPSFSSFGVQAYSHAPGGHDLPAEDTEVEVCEGRILLKRHHPSRVSSSNREGGDGGSVNEEEEEEEEEENKIDFSSVVVSLLVDGVVREEEHSSPTGYYLLRVDSSIPRGREEEGEEEKKNLKGERVVYKLQVQGRQGWKFEPSYHILPSSGRCHKEYNFYFTGYPVRGVVSLSLQKEGEEEEERTNQDRRASSLSPREIRPIYHLSDVPVRMQRVTIDSGPTASIVKPASEKPVDQWISTRTDKKGEFVFENFLPGELLRIEIAPSFFPNKDLYRLRKFFFLSSGSKLLEQRERSSSRDAKEEEEESKHDDDNEEDDGSRFLVTLDEKGEIRRVKKKKEEERGKGGQRHQIEFRLRGYSVEGLLLDEQGQPLRDAQVLLEAGNEEKKSQNSESPQTSSSSSSSFFTSFVSILNHRNCFVERQLATEGKGGSHRHAGEEVLSPFFMKRITERKERRRRRENKNEKSSLSCSTISSSTTGEFSFPILPFSPSSLRSLYIKPYQRLLLRQSSSSLGGDPAGDKQEQEEEREVVFNPVEMDLERDLLKAKRRGEEGRENVLHFPSVRVKLPSIQLAAFSIVGKVATVDPEASTSEQRKKRKALPLHAGETGGESREETGVEGARVFLRIVDKRSGVEEREEEFLTNEKGEYAVKSLPLRRKDDRQEEDEREIVLSAKKEHYTFSSIRLSFPSWRSRSFLPAIEVTSLSVCGRVVASPGSPSDAVSDLEVYVHPMLETGGRAAGGGGGGGTEGRRPEEKKTRTDEKGQFCFFLSPSTTYVLWTSFRHSSSSRYDGQEGHEGEKHEILVSLRSSPILDVVLQERRYRLEGEIHCEKEDNDPDYQREKEEEEKMKMKKRSPDQSQSLGEKEKKISPSALCSPDRLLVRMYRRTSLRRQERDGEEEEGDPVNIAHVVRKEGSRRVLRFAMEELQGGVYTVEIQEKESYHLGEGEKLCWKEKKQMVTIPPSVSSSSSSSLKGEREEDLNVPVFVKFQVRGYSLPVQANASFSAHFLPLLSQRQDHPDNTQKGEESEITSSSSSPSISFFLPKGPFPICLPSFYKQYSLRFPSYLKVSSSSPSSSSPLHVMDIATLYNGSSSPSLDLTVTERRETIEIFLFSFLKNKHSQVEKEEEREQAILSKLRKRSFEVQLLSLSPREISKEKDEEEEEERSKKMRDEDGRDLQDSHEEREEEKMKKRRREDERRPQLVGGESHCHFSREVVEADALHLLNAGKTGQRHIREKEEENKVLVHQCSVWIPISYASSSLLIRVISPSSSLLGAGTENEGGEAYEGEILFLPNSSSDVQLNKDLSLLSPRSPSSSVSPSRYFYLLPSSSMTVHSDSTDYRSLEPNRDEEEIKNKIDQEEEEKKNRDKSTRTEELQNRGDLSLSAPPTLLRIKAERQCVFRGKIEPPLENVKISFIESSSSPSSPGSKMEKKEKDSIFPSSFYTKDVFSDKTGRFVSDVFRCRDSPFVEEEKGEGEKKKDVSKMRYEDLVKGVSIEAVYQGYSFMREDLRNRVERHDRQTERKDTDMILLKAIKEPTVTVRVVLSPSKRQNVSQGETEEGEEKGLKGVLISCSSLNDSSLPAAKLLTNSDGSAVFTPKKYLLSSSSSSSQSHSSANAKEEQKSKSRAKKSVIVLRMKPLLKGYEFSPSFHTVEIPQEEAEGRGGEEAESERKKEKKVLDKVITFTARKTLFDCAGYVYPLGVEKGEKWSQEDRSSSSSLTSSQPLLVRAVSFHPSIKSSSSSEVNEKNKNEEGEKRDLSLSEQNSPHASHVEEARVGEDGRFLLRGLKPGVRYRVSVVLSPLSSSSSLSPWEGITPRHREILVTSSKDISGVDFHLIPSPPSSSSLSIERKKRLSLFLSFSYPLPSRDTGLFFSFSGVYVLLRCISTSDSPSTAAPSAKERGDVETKKSSSSSSERVREGEQKKKKLKKKKEERVPGDGETFFTGGDKDEEGVYSVRLEGLPFAVFSNLEEKEYELFLVHLSSSSLSQKKIQLRHLSDAKVLYQTRIDLRGLTARRSDESHGRVDLLLPPFTLEKGRDFKTFLSSSGARDFSSSSSWSVDSSSPNEVPHRERRREEDEEEEEEEEAEKKERYSRISIIFYFLLLSGVALFIARQYVMNFGEGRAFWSVNSNGEDLKKRKVH